ncbi:hypothetical protein Dimus_003593 [Dionaea muscipula]
MSRFRESSFCSDEGCPPCELGGGDALHVSSGGVIPYALEEGATSRGLVGVPPPYPSAARPEGRYPRKLRIKLKSRSLGESSQIHPENTTLCVVDAASTRGPLPGRGEVVPVEPSNNEIPLKSSMRPAGCQALLRFFFQKNLKFYALEPFERLNVMRSGGRIGFAVYRHSVQFGLRFPLCPFYQSLCSLLRISPSQLTPNSRGTICTFLLRCRELEIEPSPNLFFLYHGIQKCMVGSVLFLSVRALPNKKLIEIATSKVHEWKDRWCWAYGPAFPYQNTPWQTSLPELPQKKVLKKALSEAENRLLQVFDQRLKAGRLWDVNMKPSLSSLQWAGIASGSPNLSCPELELSSSSFLSIGGGGSDRFRGPDNDDVRSYVGSEEAGLRTPPLQDLTGIPSLDETGAEEGEELEEGAVLIPPIERGGSHDAEDRSPKPPSSELTRGKGVASDYPRESQKRRLPTGPIDFQDPFGGRESAVPLGGSACGSSSSMTPTSYVKERFKYEMIDGHRVELDSTWNILPRDLCFAGPQPKICGLPYLDDGFICCKSNALALVQAIANVYRHKTKGRMAEWMGRDLNWNLVQSLNIVGQLISVSQEAIVDRDAAWKKVKTLEEEISGLRDLHTELTTKYNESQDSVRRLEGSLKREKNQSTSRLTALESAQSKCRELEQKIERLEKRIVELEQQRPSSMDEMIDLWQVSEEGMAAITELSRPSTKAGYSMAFQHFGSYLSEVPSDKKWDGLPWPHDDIGVTDQNIPYYIADGSPPPIVVDAEEEREPGEVNIVGSSMLLMLI